MKVKDLIAYLQTQPEDMQVACGNPQQTKH